MTQAADASLQGTQHKLPAGWRWVQLGELFDVRQGVAMSPARRQGVGPRPFLRTVNVLWDRVDLSTLDNMDFTDEEVVDLQLNAGDLLVCEGGDVGRTAIWRGEMSVCLYQNHIHRLRRRDSSLVPEFYVYWMQAAFQAFQSYKGLEARTTIPNLSGGQLKSFVVPLPPLAEQQRIAAILSEQMVVVERARAAAEARLEAAKVLPAAYLRAVFDSPEAEKWPRKRLGEVLRLRNEVVHPQDKPSGSATFVGLEHIESGTGRRLGSVAVEKAALTGRKPCFYKSDIVYGYLRPYLNKVWVADCDGLCSVDQYVYSLDQSTAYVDFVAWFMRSPVYLTRAPIGLTPGQLPRIRTEEVSSVEINLPHLAEQRRVCAILNEQMSLAERVREALEGELDTINRLPAALLRRAFSGGL